MNALKKNEQAYIVAGDNVVTSLDDPFIMTVRKINVANQTAVCTNNNSNAGSSNIILSAFNVFNLSDLIIVDAKWQI